MWFGLDSTHGVGSGTIVLFRRVRLPFHSGVGPGKICRAGVSIVIVPPGSVPVRWGFTQLTRG